MSKIIKKGTTVTFKWSYGYAGTDNEETFELTADTSLEGLEKDVWDLATQQVEAWVEVEDSDA